MGNDVHQNGEEEVTPSGTKVLRYGSPKDTPVFGLSNAPPEWQELRENHYEKHFGPATSVIHEVLPLIPHIDVHIFPPNDELGRTFTTLATSGMSDELMNLPDEAPPEMARVELLMYVPEFETVIGSTQFPWFIQALRMASRFPFDYETWISPGHTIPNGNPPQPVSPASQLTTMFFLPSIFEEPAFNEIKLDSNSIEFLWLSFLSDSETGFKLNKGYDSFVNKISPENFPQVLDEKRSPIV